MHYTVAENSKEEYQKMPGTVSPNLIITLLSNLHSSVSMMSLLFILGPVPGSLQRTSCAVVMYLNNVVTVGGHPPCLCIVGMKTCAWDKESGGRKGFSVELCQRWASCRVTPFYPGFISKIFIWWQASCFRKGFPQGAWFPEIRALVLRGADFSQPCASSRWPQLWTDKAPWMCKIF